MDRGGIPGQVTDLFQVAVWLLESWYVWLLTYIQQIQMLSIS